MESDKILPIFFILPSFALVFFAYAYPIIWQAYFSFFKLDINLEATYVGLRNFQRLFSDPDFINSLRNALYFVGGSVAGQIGIGFTLALILRRPLKGKEFFRSFFLITWLLSDVFIGIAFILVFTTYGSLNEIIKYIGLRPIEWLNNPSLAMLVVTLANIWKSACFYMLMTSAGLASIPNELYEVAEVDGAGLFQRFFNITLPLIRPILLLAITFSIVTTLNYFGVIYVITYGGPLGATTVPSFYMYRAALEWGELGYASAIGILILLVNLLLTGFYVRYTFVR